MKHLFFPTLIVFMISPAVSAQENKSVSGEAYVQIVAGEEKQQQQDGHGQTVAGEELQQRWDQDQHDQIVAGEEHQQRQNNHPHEQIVAGEEHQQPRDQEQHEQIVAGEEHQQRQDKHQQRQKQEILSLIDNYSLARETQDTVLLKRILTTDIDQLVSSGEWRYGIRGAMEGMVQSTTGNPGTRKLVVENIRFLTAENAIADARYEIQNAGGTTRKMWSTFIVVYLEKSWKIAAIRNMLPSGQ